MEQSRIELAYVVDALVDAGRATITESRSELALYQLDGAGARRVAELLEPAGFALIRLGDDGGELQLHALDDVAEGIELVAAKPLAPAGIFPILTNAGFCLVLQRPVVEHTLWIQGLKQDLLAVTMAYRPWGSAEDFQPEVEPSSPARVVRALGDRSVETIGRWLARDPDVDLTSEILLPWRIRATEALASALAQEVEPDDSLFFRGPPPTRFRSVATDHIKVESLVALQRAAGWVYENPRELGLIDIQWSQIMAAAR